MSAFYFDIRKDSLYCDAKNDIRRRAARTVLDELFKCMTIWFAPILAFTSEEVWLSRHGDDAASVHLQQFPSLPSDWQNEALEDKWSKVKELRNEVTAAIEPLRRDKVVGSSLQADVAVTVPEQAYIDAVKGMDLKEIFITSGAAITVDGASIQVSVSVADGEKCDRCWMVLPEVADNGELCNRCSDAVETYDAEAAE